MMSFPFTIVLHYFRQEEQTDLAMKFEDAYCEIQCHGKFVVFNTTFLGQGIIDSLEKFNRSIEKDYRLEDFRILFTFCSNKQTSRIPWEEKD